MANRKFDLAMLIAEGSHVDTISIRAPEDPEDKAARLHRESWSFYVKDLAPHSVAFLFLPVIGGYCCFVVA